MIFCGASPTLLPSNTNNCRSFGYRHSGGRVKTTFTNNYSVYYADSTFKLTFALMDKEMEDLINTLDLQVRFGQGADTKSLTMCLNVPPSNIHKSVSYPGFRRLPKAPSRPWTPVKVPDFIHCLKAIDKARPEALEKLGPLSCDLNIGTPTILDWWSSEITCEPRRLLDFMSTVTRITSGCCVAAKFSEPAYAHTPESLVPHWKKKKMKH